MFTAVTKIRAKMSESTSTVTATFLSIIKKDPVLYGILALVLGTNSLDLLGPTRIMMEEQRAQTERIVTALDQIEEQLGEIDDRQERHADRITALEIGQEVLGYRVTALGAPAAPSIVTQ